MNARTLSFQRWLGIVLVALCLPLALWSQGARGTITGVVKDATGAIIPGVAVRVTQTETGVSTNTVSQANGAYLVPSLNPGTYNVSAEAPGFKKITIDNLKVDVATTLTQDISLQVGQVSESVEVAGQNSLVETTTAAVGTTVYLSQVLELVVPDRNIFALVNLAPGSWLRGSGRGTQVSLGGGRNQSQRATIDGIDNTRGGTGVQNVEMTVPVDSVQEFRVQTNNMSAEYGLTSSGVLNVVTRGGTNEFHGGAYEFLRNDKFDALGWGNTTKQKLRRNNYGASIGGPIKKNKAFFFFNWDKMKQIQANTQIWDVGLPAWRTGNFSTATRNAGGVAAVVPIYDPETGTGTFGAPRATLQFPGNIIPANRLDPIALKMIGYYPTPNRIPDNSFNQQGNYAENVPTELFQNYYVWRIDHELTSKDKIYGRYIYVDPFGNEGGGTNWGPGRQNREANRQQNMALNLTHLFSPTFFANFTAGFFRWRQSTQAGCAWCGVDYAKQIGFNGVIGPMLPLMTVAGGLVPIASFGGGPDRFANGLHSNVLADFTKVRGSHTFKFGAVYDKFNSNIKANTQASGNWTFDGHFTRGITDTGAAVANTGINMADMLLGRITSANLTVTPARGTRSFHTGTYFQDDWRVSPRLTLNFGMRWDIQNPPHAVDDRNSNFDPYQVSPLAGTGDIPAGAKGVMTYQGKNGYGTYLWDWDKKILSPRFGFAWRMFGTNDTVLRGGYGIFFGSQITNGADNQGLLPFGQNYSVGDPVPFRLRDGAPAGATLTPPRSDWVPEFGQRGTKYATNAVSFYDPHMAYPYAQNINLSLQHQFKGMLVEVAYVASLGRHAPNYPQNINLIPQNLLSNTSLPERLKRPFTVFTGNNPSVTNQEPTFGISNYNALTLHLERRMKNGLGYSLSYTWSKLIDDISVQTGFAFTWGDNNNPQNIYDRKNERSLSTIHIPHRMVVAPVYELPFGKGKRFLNQGGVVNAILGGWQVSSVGTLQAGAPFGPTVLNGGRDLLGDQSSLLRPNLIGDPNSPNKGQPAVGIRGLQWLNPAAFSNPAPFTYGNQARTLSGILTPGIIRFDSLLAKNFRFKERFRIQFRWEMLDMFNTPYFDNVGRFPNNGQILGTGSFGIVPSANTDSRRIMQMGLKLYF